MSEDRIRVRAQVRLTFLVAALASVAASANAATVFSRVPSGGGGFSRSAWVDPNGSDADEYSYDSFEFRSPHQITEVRWYGTHQFGYSSVSDFRVTFYNSIAGGSQPLCGNPDMTETTFVKDYWVGSNANETAAPAYGTGMAAYNYVLSPAPFTAEAKTKYWLKIEASQPAYPDWGIATGHPGNGRNFHYFTGGPYFLWSSAGNTAFTLVTADPPAPYTLGDLTLALQIIAGIEPAYGDDRARLNVEDGGASSLKIDWSDALRIARKVAGLEANP